MNLMMESFWRALVDSFRPRVIALSLLPLGIIAAAALVLGFFYWASAVAAVAAWMDASSVWTWVDTRLLALGFANATSIFAPILVVLLVTPLLVIVALLLVTMFMTPMMANDVALRRFPGLQRLGKQNAWHSLGWSLVSTLAAIVALVVTLPLWLIPPLALVLPPLIWGWLAYRVLSFDALVQHASANERKLLLEQHRWPLLVIGVVCGFLGAAPSVVWASGVLFTIAFAVLIPVAVWLFTWVFAFTSLWYAHYCLAELQRLRGPVAKPVVVEQAEPARITAGPVAPSSAGARPDAPDAPAAAGAAADPPAPAVIIAGYSAGTDAATSSAAPDGPARSVYEAETQQGGAAPTRPEPPLDVRLADAPAPSSGSWPGAPDGDVPDTGREDGQQAAGKAADRAGEVGKVDDLPRP